ncbi:MAG: hypothetical protein OEV15_01050 [Gallionella sp.]|nr:hypothetical protein [Gallionella sp.]
MVNRLHYVVYALLLPAAFALAEDSDEKTVSGMSIVGNNETHKSLSLVPWRASETGKEVSLSSSILKEELKPVDKSEFIRELDYYRYSNSN